MATTEHRDNEALESEESAVECHLARAEETLNEATKVLFEDFATTMTVSGLQPRRFLERTREERRDISATFFRQKGEPFLVQKQVFGTWH